MENTARCARMDTCSSHGCSRSSSPETCTQPWGRGIPGCITHTSQVLRLDAGAGIGGGKGYPLHRWRGRGRDWVADQRRAGGWQEEPSWERQETQSLTVWGPCGGCSPCIRASPTAPAGAPCKLSNVVGSCPEAAPDPSEPGCSPASVAGPSARAGAAAPWERARSEAALSSREHPRRDSAGAHASLSASGGGTSSTTQCSEAAAPLLWGELGTPAGPRRGSSAALAGPGACRRCPAVAMRQCSARRRGVEEGEWRPRDALGEVRP